MDPFNVKLHRAQAAREKVAGLLLINPHVYAGTRGIVTDSLGPGTWAQRRVCPKRCLKQVGIAGPVRSVDRVDTKVALGGNAVGDGRAIIVVRIDGYIRGGPAGIRDRSTSRRLDCCQGPD